MCVVIDIRVWKLSSGYWLSSCLNIVHHIADLQQGKDQYNSYIWSCMAECHIIFATFWTVLT